MKTALPLLCILFLNISLCGQNEQYNWDTITFETKKDYLVLDTSQNNIWEVCEPNKNFFDSAYSNRRAILTDSTGFYPANNLSSFDVLLGGFNVDWFPDDFCLGINHKYDTDALKDGGFITISLDGGSTWHNILEDLGSWPMYPAATGKNLYSESELLHDGNYGYSGNSGGWVQTEFCWYQLPVKNTSFNYMDTIIVRFNFTSDNESSQKEGWMIDDIRLFSVDMGSDLNENYSAGFSFYPNPAKNYITVKFDEIHLSIEIEILSYEGKTIKRQSFDNVKIINFQIEELKSGIYFLKITPGSNQSIFRKFIVHE